MEEKAILAGFFGKLAEQAEAVVVLQRQHLSALEEGVGVVMIADDGATSFIPITDIYQP